MAQDTDNKPNPTQVQKFLGGVDYPVGKDDILARAKEQGAPQDVMDLLQKLPDRQYEGPNGIIKELY